MAHIALSGDSIFDNASYVDGGPDVCNWLKQSLPEGWSATLCAVDGAMIADVPARLNDLPPNATHLMISAGGSDALSREHLLRAPASSSTEVLLILSDAIAEFELANRRAIARVCALKRPSTLCTISNADFRDATQPRVAKVAIALYDDVILRCAREHGLTCIDLRTVCTDRSDYANDVEPCVERGRKIAAAILGSLRGDQLSGRLPSVGCNVRGGAPVVEPRIGIVPKERVFRAELDRIGAG